MNFTKYISLPIYSFRKWIFSNVDGTSVVLVTGKNFNGHILLTIVDKKNHLAHLIYTIEQFTKANCPKTGP